ncbi:MAG: glycogen/starch synthase, partial [Gammaproteobacteria bacterium]
MQRILYVTSEAHPLMKTGGLGDVAGSLPRALQGQHQDVRLITPAYGDTLARTGELPVVAELTVAGGTVRLRAGTLPGSHVQVWLVDHPPSFARPGNPYVGPDHLPWHDNADRFALFARTVVEVAMDRAGLRWQPDVVHCNDWQSGLVPALIAQEPAGDPPARPATVFTIHNMAYQGLFPYSTFVALGLPAQLWGFEALEFHGQLSFMKGGLVFADEITTVSPSYAHE